MKEEWGVTKRCILLWVHIHFSLYGCRSAVPLSVRGLRSGCTVGNYVVQGSTDSHMSLWLSLVRCSSVVVRVPAFHGDCSMQRARWNLLVLILCADVECALFPHQAEESDAIHEV